MTLLIPLIFGCGGESVTGEEISFRLIAEDLQEGDPWSVLIAGSSEAFVELGLSVAVGDVDFATDVVLVFNPPESTSCPYQPIKSLRYDSSQNLVYPVVPTKGGPECTSNAGQHRIVVVVQRADLPSRDFQLWINSPPGPPQGTTVPTVDAGTMTMLGNP